jgi:2-desacetyl-2-hydroxyethyl bacteriochlorophyllide A dehydrogenase
VKAIVKTAAVPGALEWQEWGDPELRPGHVLVEIESAGICSTDVAIYDWAYPGRRPVELPAVLGHEAAGTVIDLAEDVADVSSGERVALQVIWGRPHSRPSLLGFENLDPDWRHIGASPLGGAFAERIAIPADRVVVLPGSVAWDDGALLEPLAVAAHAVELCALAPGEDVAVVGPGQFGLLMAMIARAAGAARIAVVGLADIDEARLDRARELGVDTTLTHAGDLEQTAAALMEATGGGADVVMDCGGTPDSTWLSLEAAGAGGRVGVFGFTHEVTIQPLRQVIRKGLTLRGVSAAQRRHYGVALRLIETGLVRPSAIVSHRLPVAQAAEGIELVKSRVASKVLLEVR